MSWKDFKTLTREELFPSNEMQKLETKLWNHVMVRATMLHILIGPMSWLGMMATTEPMTIQKAVQIASTLTDEAIRNVSIKKNPEKRGNRGETNKDTNGRDDNKRTRTRNVYATTLFDSGADYSFVSTTFIHLLGIEPSALGFSHEIEIASRQLVEIDKNARVRPKGKVRYLMSAKAKEHKQEEIVTV
uniref:Reverse transcriptase domain-containing protein n=1 Tax=Tanacetum cinerariifolium TaxID=118510 RepID=A0A699RMP4_TANCI|nr:reverse transcriptase domain-containing protein [Tanacetum cinerariifolium]